MKKLQWQVLLVHVFNDPKPLDSYFLLFCETKAYNLLIIVFSVDKLLRNWVSLFAKAKEYALNFKIFDSFFLLDRRIR